MDFIETWTEIRSVCGGSVGHLQELGRDSGRKEERFNDWCFIFSINIRQEGLGNVGDRNGRFLLMFLW